MRTRIHIAIAEPSVIIRSGIISVLKRLTTLNIEIFEITDMTRLSSQLCKWHAEILIVNPTFLGMASLQQVKSNVTCKELKYIALQNALTDTATLSAYDEIISIYDTAEQIKEKISKLYENETYGDRDMKQELSAREKEIIVCVVKGLTNKQIADYLCLSTHTVITHRRNIANKLQIHSPAGLTIYAIVNKLVELNDIKL
jgi:DNA-binding NarL/FixJ family response regulator